MSSPKNFFASLRARSQALAISAALATRRMPLPPPPDAALSITGKPIFVAAARRLVGRRRSARPGRWARRRRPSCRARPS